MHFPPLRFVVKRSLSLSLFTNISIHPDQLSPAQFVPPLPSHFPWMKMKNQFHFAKIHFIPFIWTILLKSNLILIDGDEALRNTIFPTSDTNPNIFKFYVIYYCHYYHYFHAEAAKGKLEEMKGGLGRWRAISKPKEIPFELHSTNSERMLSQMICWKTCQ